MWAVVNSKGRVILTSNVEHAAWKVANQLNARNYQTFKKTGRFGRFQPVTVTTVEA